MARKIISISTGKPWQPEIKFKPDPSRSKFENAIDEHIERMKKLEAQNPEREDCVNTQ